MNTLRSPSLALIVFLSLAGFCQATTYTPTVLTDPPVSGGVNSANGVISGGAGAGQVSLRSAIIAANAHAGPDTITFNAGLGTTYTLTLVNAAGNEDACQTGDLDVTDTLTITGNGPASTIIQAGTTNANGIDKVFAINPFCDHPISFTITGVTVRFGRNTQPFGASDFSYTGGGLDWCEKGTGALTISNCVFSDNTNVNGYGGGINIDEVAPAISTIAISNTTITNNKSASTGGGINIFGDNGSTTITGCTISNNMTTGANSGAHGGGVNIRVTNQNDNDGAPVPVIAKVTG